MWPEYWRTLTELPHSTVERHRREHHDETLDRHRAARALGQAVEVTMPRGYITEHGWDQLDDSWYLQRWMPSLRRTASCPDR
ncbi:sugar phosphate isomerase/epimerase [Actinomadura citrea]|uniref:Sugar phosphate isomerase/epimerase n=2 Tax=Actinomadura citrea TaxID=46158 RepID=A0A7Y9KBR6_9ACTN|nr:sugar phosphate isomerase/epimerase [Actinomadura citrea]